MAARMTGTAADAGTNGVQDTASMEEARKSPPTSELEGIDDMEGHRFKVDRSKVYLGLLEDLQAGQFKDILDGLAAVIVDSDFPHGHDRDGLRRLSYDQSQGILGPILDLIQTPKAGDESS